MKLLGFQFPWESVLHPNYFRSAPRKGDVGAELGSPADESPSCRFSGSPGGAAPSSILDSACSSSKRELKAIVKC